MQTEVFQGILIPFLGTTLGSACVLFMKKQDELGGAEGADICRGKGEERIRNYGGIQGLSVPYQAVLHRDAAWPARLSADRAVCNDDLVWDRRISPWRVKNIKNCH